MIISYCIPVHNRTYDLRETLPGIIRAASNSPPVEVVILDYNSQDDLADYMRLQMGLPSGAFNDLGAWGNGWSLVYKKYKGRDNYHMAHARNLSILASSGDWVVSSGSDIILDENYFKVLRTTIEKEQLKWIRHGRRYVGVIWVKRDEFMDAGGYDERFEYYGKEDKDLLARLERRGGAFAVMPDSLLGLIPTPKEEKFKHYRGNMTRQQMGKYAKRIYQENIDNNVLVVNEGGWGKWD